MTIHEASKKLEIDFIQNSLKLLFPQLSPDIPLNSSTSTAGVLNQIGSFAFNISNTDFHLLIPETKPTTNRFIHFTSIPGLFNILKTQCIRLYSINNLNDPNEFKLFNKVRPGTNWSEFKKSIFCLSLINAEIQKNSAEILNLWRLYGSNGYGAFIEFEIGEIHTSQTGPLLSNVLYQEDEHIDKFLDAIIDFESRNSVSFDQRSKFNILKYYSMLFKSNLFKHENEVRLFYFLNSTAPQIADKSEKIFPEINRRNHIVYYKEWHFDQEAFSSFPQIKPVKVQLGFNCEKKLGKELTESLNNYFLISSTITPPFEASPLGNVFNI